MLFLCFRTADVKMLVKCLQICAHVFINRPQNCAQTSFRLRAGLWPNFCRSRSKLCPILCRLRTKLCPNFGRSRIRLCPISFAPCPFPNLAGTIDVRMYLPTLTSVPGIGKLFSNSECTLPVRLAFGWPHWLAKYTQALDHCVNHRLALSCPSCSTYNRPTGCVYSANQQAPLPVFAYKWAVSAL